MYIDGDFIKAGIYVVKEMKHNKSDVVKRSINEPHIPTATI